MGKMNGKAIRTVIGGILVHFTFGTIYTCANMITYIISYLHVVEEQLDVDYRYSGWLFALDLMGQAVGMLLAGPLQKLSGNIACTGIGSMVLSACVFAAYYVRSSFMGILGLYGFGHGVGIGLGYASSINAAIQWMPSRSGLASGLILGGYGFGALIFNNVQTRIINPENLPPIVDPTGATQDLYFQFSVASRLPVAFIYLSGFYILLQTIGIALMENAPSTVKTELSIESAQLQVEVPTSEVKDGDHASTPLMPDKPVAVKSTRSFTTKEALKTGDFWFGWVNFLLSGLVVTYISSTWKIAGQTLIKDDRFVVAVGAVSSVFNGLSRPLWGMLVDRFGFLLIMTINLLVMSLSLFLHGIALTVMNKWMFGVFICFIYTCVGGIYAMYPFYTNTTFGPKYMVPNYGAMFSNQIFAALFSAVLLGILTRQMTLSNLNIVFLLVCLMTFALMAVRYFQMKRKLRKLLNVQS